MTATILPFIGETITEVEVTSATIHFKFESGKYADMYHDQDCCESVYIDDVNGDWDDLKGVPLIIAEVVTDHIADDEYESLTWTFYKFATIKGYVDVTWRGESNGYYSETVTINYDGEVFY